MNLLLRRAQTTGTIGGVQFKLWAKTELDDDEHHIIGRYRFDNARVIVVPQPSLSRNAIVIGVGFAAVLAFLMWRSVFGMPVAIIAGIAAGYFYYDYCRETVFVRDLMYGRYFTCDSVVDLARKEAWLKYVVAVLRQVMETAKHWDGTETIPIAALSVEEAKYIAIKGL
jgi:hypothetical protein